MKESTVCGCYLQISFEFPIVALDFVDSRQKYVSVRFIDKKNVGGILVKSNATAKISHEYK